MRTPVFSSTGASASARAFNRLCTILALRYGIQSVSGSLLYLTLWLWAERGEKLCADLEGEGVAVEGLVEEGGLILLGFFAPKLFIFSYSSIFINKMYLLFKVSCFL